MSKELKHLKALAEKRRENLGDKANTYKGGYDNGFALGYAQGIEKAIAELTLCR